MAIRGGQIFGSAIGPHRRAGNPTSQQVGIALGPGRGSR